VRPKGRLDLQECPHFEKRIRPLLVSATKTLILDMEDLDYISSAGLGVIFETRKLISGNKGIFVIVGLKPQIRKVFDILKVLPKESFFATMKDVDEYLKNN
jgi:anti-anti-sigma factor